MSEQANNAGEAEAFEMVWADNHHLFPAIVKIDAREMWRWAWKARGEQDAARIAELKKERDLWRLDAEGAQQRWHLACHELESLRQASPVGEPEIMAYLPTEERDALRMTLKAMADKVYAKYLEGYGGFDDASEEWLNQLLHEHLAKGDPIDIANFCAFLFYNGQRVTAPPAVSANKVPDDGWQLMDMGWLRSMMHVNFLRCHPDKSHEAISAEIDRVLAAAPKPGEQP